MSMCELTFPQPMILLILFYNDSEEEGCANFKQFYDLGMYYVFSLSFIQTPLMYRLGPVTDHTCELLYEELNGILNGTTIPGRKTYMVCNLWILTPNVVDPYFLRVEPVYDRVLCHTSTKY